MIRIRRSRARRDVRQIVHMPALFGHDEQVGQKERIRAGRRDVWRDGNLRMFTYVHKGHIDFAARSKSLLRARRGGKNRVRGITDGVHSLRSLHDEVVTRTRAASPREMNDVAPAHGRSNATSRADIPGCPAPCGPVPRGVVVDYSAIVTCGAWAARAAVERVSILLATEPTMNTPLFARFLRSRAPASRGHPRSHAERGGVATAEAVRGG